DYYCQVYDSSGDVF
nr:immunoglobulin light chain junction region [Macaca mulatta]